MEEGQWRSGLLAFGELHRIGRPQPKHARRDLLVEAEETKVLAAHYRIDLDHVIRAEQIGEHVNETLCQGRIIKGWRSGHGLVDMNGRRAFSRDACGGSH